MFLPHSSELQPSASDGDGDASAPVISEETQTPAEDTASSSTSLPAGVAMDRPADIALVAVSGSADFEAVRGWCDTVSRVGMFVSHLRRKSH